MQLIRTIVAIAIAIAPMSAHAFVTGAAFDADPLIPPPADQGGYFPGAGGIAFTGAPRWSGHTCAVCHTNAPGHIGIRVEADQPTLFDEGWDPKKQYHLRVVLENEVEAVAFAASGDSCGAQNPPTLPYKHCDTNGFALEMDDGGGNPTGTFTTVTGAACSTAPNPDAAVYINAAKTAVIQTDTHKGITSWDFCWTSPGAGAGTITAYVAVVDGNGGLGTADVPNDPIGDDVATGTVPIAEKAAFGNGADAGGCAVGGGDAGLAVVVVAAALAFRRKHLAAVVAIATLAGCVHVRPRQREVLARPNMKFAPDPSEDELDLHMQESREGSSGGYGSSGGGCGCN